MIFAQDCTAYNHLVELYRVLTSTVSYQKKMYFLLFIGYSYLGPFKHSSNYTYYVTHSCILFNMNEENYNLGMEIQQLPQNNHRFD